MSTAYRLVTRPQEFDQHFSPETVDRAAAAWAEYERTHDLKQLHGQAVGIDLETGEFYFGRDKYEIDDALRAAGRYPRPMLLTRVGLGYYARLRPGRRVSCSSVG